MNFGLDKGKEKRQKMPQSVRFAVFRRDNFSCRYCGKSSPDVELHVDHVHPVSSGGTDDLENLVTACSECNYGKSAKNGVRPPSNGSSKNVTTDDSLVGFFGHRLNEKGDIENQFRILRRVGDNAHAIQLYSYLDGGPTNIEVVSGAELTGKFFRLYATEQAWIFANCEQMAKWNRERGADPWLCSPHNIYSRYFDEDGKRGPF